MSDSLLNFTLTSFVSIFFVVNPLGNTPVFLAITENESPTARLTTVRRSSIAMAGVLIFVSLFGQYVLNLFNLSLAAIRIAGGVILFLLALNMIQAERAKLKSRREEESEARDKPDVSIVPLAIPMLAGPGSMTTILVLTGQHHDWAHRLIIVAAICFTGVMSYIIMSRAAILLKLLGKTGINMFTRLMGLLLSAIAIQFILNGIAGALPTIVSKMK